MQNTNTVASKHARLAARAILRKHNAWQMWTNNYKTQHNVKAIIDGRNKRNAAQELIANNFTIKETIDGIIVVMYK